MTKDKKWEYEASEFGKPGYELCPATFWRAWNDHTEQGDPHSIVKQILDLPPDKVTVSSMPGMGTLLLTVMEAVIDGQRWALIGHTYGTDTMYVFQLQPRGKSPK